tara:strand:+ start:15713 stop:17986 length:2274 start_codon:yes stop_codon:yes gene_type:complete
MKLMILESGAKGKTVEKYLGKGWIVEACFGHVQDLPRSGKQGNKAMWASEKGQLPNPPWEWTDRAERVVSKILAKAKKNNVSDVYIATDPDREGEFIAWRLANIFSEFPFVTRVTFNEITKEAVENAINNHREVDHSLVEAAKVRRFMDRLVGFRCSKFAKSWNLRSMGRVQTPTLGYIVDREIERESHVPIPYHSVHATSDRYTFKFRFHGSSDEDAWRDDSGKFFSDRTFNIALAEEAHLALSSAGSFTVNSVRPGKTNRKPPPPFTTDTMLQSSSSSLGWSMAKTSKIASELYNKGYITYIRTDSTRTSVSARESAKSVILEEFGVEFLGEGSLGPDAKKGSKNVQDAHEAIRPTDPKLEVPEEIEDDATRLYSLIRSRFISSQMSDSIRERREIYAEVDGTELLISGTASWRIHAGWEAVSAQFLPEPRINEPKFDASVGSVWAIDGSEENPIMTTDETKPPRRYTESSIVKKMKAAGIGRPSTYVSTVQKLSDRKYVNNENGSLSPTNNGMVLWTEVAPIYNDQEEENKLFSSDFTADMERRLDMVEDGGISGSEMWDSFTKSFKTAHDNALEIRRSKPTPKQIWAIENRINHLPEDVRNELLGGKEVSDITGKEASELIEVLIEKEGENGGPKPSEKQLSYLTSLIEKSKMSDEEALKLVNVSDYSELTGGRSGTASELIGMMKEANESLPASEPQIDLIKSMAEKQGIPMRDVLAMAELAEVSDITKSEASKLISNLKAMNKKAKRKKRK